MPRVTRKSERTAREWLASDSPCLRRRGAAEEGALCCAGRLALAGEPYCGLASSRSAVAPAARCRPSAEALRPCGAGALPYFLVRPARVAADMRCPHILLIGGREARQIFSRMGQRRGESAVRCAWVRPGDRPAVPNSWIELDSAGARAGSATLAGAVGTRSSGPLLIAMRCQQLAALLSARRCGRARFSRSSIVILPAECGATRSAFDERARGSYVSAM